MRMRFLLIVMAAMAATSTLATANTPSEFDGQWTITMTCASFNEDDDDARGYTHHFPAEVKNGEFRGERGTAGEPGWHLLTGAIPPDGRTRLKFDGIVKNEAYAVNNAQRGKPYTYGVRAKFSGSRGEGKRIGKRPCEFVFAKTS